MRQSLFLSWSWAIFTVFRVFPILRRFVYICLLHKKSGCNTGGQSVKLCLLPLLRADFLFLRADFLFLQADFLFYGAHQTGSQPVKTGSQPVKTGRQPVKQEVNKVLKTGFLFYGLTTCVMGRCKQILTYFLLSADASLDIGSLTKTSFLLHLSQPTEV